MLKFLIEAFKASKGRMPNNMEMILLKQKAAKQSVDERKVVSMFDRSAVNPNKPILGGKNIPETEEEIRQRLLKNNEKGLASMKSKLEDPEKKADGGRIGFKGGADFATVADSKGNVGARSVNVSPSGSVTTSRTRGPDGPDDRSNFTQNVNHREAMRNYQKPKESKIKKAIEAGSEASFLRNLYKMDPIGLGLNIGGKILYNRLIGDQSSLPTEEEGDDTGIMQMADLNSLGLTQMRNLEKKKAMEPLGGDPFTDKDQQMLDELERRDADPDKTYGPVLAADGGRIGLKGGGRDFEMSDSEKEFEAYKNYLMNEGMIQGDKQLRDQMEKHKKKLMEKRYGIAVANGGRIGYKFGTGKKGVEGLIDLIRNKFGKKSITTADKAPIPPKTLERDMFKKADERFNKTDSDIYEDNLKNLEDLGAPKLAERFRLKKKYPGITDDLLDKILIDDNVQRKAEVLATIDEVFRMLEKGKGTDEILDTMKNVTRTKQADGGTTRIGLKAGSVDKMRRLILKAFGAGTLGVGAAKSGIFSFGKGAGKEVAKEVVQKSTNTPPPYFFKLAEKIKMLGDDATATTDRTIAKTLKSKDGKSTYVLEEDVSTGDTIIKKVNKEGDEMITDVQIMELRKGEVVKGKDGKALKTPDEYEEVTEANMRIEGDTFNDPYYSDGIEEIEMKKIIDEVGDQAPSIKKAGGGIARMLGE